MKMKQLVLVVISTMLLLLGAEAGDDLSTECSKVVEKVIPCLNFATGKESSPKKDCCDAMESMKETNPECLCYVIQQTHKGNPQIKSLGIQEAKLLQLPNLCQLKNASLSNCPKLLGLSPSSPDAAIFTNSSKTTPSSSVSTQSATPVSQNASSDGNMVRGVSMTHVMMVVLAIVVAAIPCGFVSNSYT
ncbi:hypothetical protein Fmac_013867 [Flemingia macrophylla]|uniref:Bifunctional inhibitor/plant lipid transfer protein/seed storage helical domain-containing protein n=1 Tax=Flemingia macrophylla TaxID=520843 RepID=A0ABD1MA60_9FABA